LIVIDYGHLEAALVAHYDKTWVGDRWWCDLQWKRAIKWTGRYIITAFTQINCRTSERFLHTRTCISHQHGTGVLYSVDLWQTFSIATYLFYIYPHP
jgi:hypothetical protein